MGGVEPAGDYVLELLARGKHVVTANKQLVARRGAELFAAASAAGVQLRFEASVCAAIPVIKVLREALVVSNVHRVLGIVNGTTNFMLTEMEAGETYDEALAEAQRLGFAEADPTEDVSGADAAAKMAILATVAFGSRVTLDDVDVRGDRLDRPARRRGGARDRDGRPAGRRGARSSTGTSTFASGRRSSTATTRWPRSRARSTRSCSRATRSARSRSRAPARAGSRRPRRSSPTWSSVSGRRAPASSRTTRSGASCRACRPASSARRSTCASRSTTGRACSRTSPSGWPSARSRRAAGPASERRRRGAARRHPRGARGRGRRPRSRRSRRCRRCAASPLPFPVVSDRGVCGARMGVIDRFRERLPVGPDDPALTLGEGSTPLVRAPRLSERLGVEL